MQFTDRGKIGSSAFAKNIEVKHLNMYTFELVQECLQVHAPIPGSRLIKCLCTFKSKTILYFQHVQFTLLFMIKFYNYDETKCTSDFNLSSQSISTLYMLILYFEFYKLPCIAQRTFVSTRLVQLVELRGMQKL